MSALDPQTLLVVNVANLLALAILLPVIMGDRLSAAARAARLSLIVHAGAWIAVILSEASPARWLDLLLSGLSMAGYSLSNWLLFGALNGWLGPRRGRRLLAGLAIAMPLGYLAFFDHYAWRVGWSNLLIALQVALLAGATRNPETRLHGRWRHALFVCFAAMALLTLARGILGAFFSELYPSFAAPHPINLLALFVANISMVLANVSLLVAWREEAELQLREQARLDPLTRVLNRRGWDEQAGRLFAHARRHGQALAALSFDLDHFKRINDERGHEAGDAALRLFGRLLHDGQRAGDVVARTGGEEFCILLPLADAAAANGYFQRLRKRLAEQAPTLLGFSFTFSGGLALLGNEDAKLEHLLQRSDEALYAAKRAGRDCLVGG